MSLLTKEQIFKIRDQSINSLIKRKKAPSDILINEL